MSRNTLSRNRMSRTGAAHAGASRRESTGPADARSVYPVAPSWGSLILGDTKPDYTPLIRALGGQVITVGRGLDRINPLDSGPLGQVVDRMSGPDADRLRLEIRGRRLSLLLALCTLVRAGRVTNPEEVILGR